MEDIKVGDVVQLNSGGPKMTVASINPRSYDPESMERTYGLIWTVECSEHYGKLSASIEMFKKVGASSPEEQV
jgi:uncharacterized protein YodC (DUF2158 family)